MDKAEGKAPAIPVASAEPKQPFSVWRWLKAHPLADPKFAFFIFCLIPVQTLFAHNWLTLPMYVERAYKGTWPWISENFEPATNFNPLLIFILVPIVTALSARAKVYNMMIAGTFVMAAPTFLLAIGPYPWTLTAYLVLSTLGEAMWQPRFLQYAAEIAPEGRTGAYMGVAQFPWFLTKVIVSLYSGWFLLHYCPDAKSLESGVGVMATEQMWLIYAVIAVSSTVMLVLARNWLGKDFKTKAA
jgi:proton-dependent oligopeptide transporter, POT family